MIFSRDEDRDATAKRRKLDLESRDAFSLCWISPTSAGDTKLRSGFGLERMVDALFLGLEPRTR